jgi:hypothetical protein
LFSQRLQPKYEPVEDVTSSDELDSEDARALQPASGADDGIANSKKHAPDAFVSRSHLPALRAAAEFVLIMGYIYLCDRTTLIPKGPKELSKERFWALNLLILLAGIISMRPSSTQVDTHFKPMQRDQTEEWKGWMQIMFILYHYFAEAEIYNAIRLYIAAYVFLTGFGNFSYYYIKQDFTLVRFAQMMWRLNFFVFFVCATMNNEYMLYYICPMHTFFTWGVYVTLWAGNQLNSSNAFLLFKMGVLMVITLVLYGFKSVFDGVFGPAVALLGFHDPLHPEFSDALHEWYFRSHLDHLVWIFGMLCAFCFPWADRQLQRIDELPTTLRFAAKAGVAAAVLLLGSHWYVNTFVLPKREYNKFHPYTSWIPILCYLVLRNLSNSMRRYSMHLFSWCGKVTLETYILQFHIWMKTTGINGSPKHLMVWVPGFYWLNFALTSAVFLFVSYRVFQVTVVLRDACISKDPASLGRGTVAMVVIIGLFYAAGMALHSMLAPSSPPLSTTSGAT